MNDHDPDEMAYAALAAPFDENEIRQREGSGGRMLSYITPRTARKRLNEVLGAANWECEVTPSESWVKCRLTVRLPSGRTVTREALGGYPEKMSSKEDIVKGGDSDAFKRAAALHGVGESLFGDDTAFVGGGYRHEERPPAERPRQAPPRGAQGDGAPSQARPAPTSGGNQFGDRPPRSGKALFAFAKDAEQKYQVGLLKYLTQWSKMQEFPGRMVDFTPEQVALAYAEAQRKLAPYQGGGAREEALEEAPAH